MFYPSLFISGFSSGLDVLEEWGFESLVESRTMISLAKIAENNDSYSVISDFYAPPNDRLNGWSLRFDKKKYSI